jgi:NAD(P)-dependent dehydrogenase (short-subunit alcohol dehydrogenase family)
LIAPSLQIRSAHASTQANRPLALADGSAVKKLLEERGHTVVSVGRTSGDFQADISDPSSLKKLFTTINHMVEGFVKAAAVELPRGVRINCISPTVLTESVAYHAYFTGFTPVPATEVALAYLRAISHPITGRILKPHKTNS